METEPILIALVDDHTLFRNGVNALMSEFDELKVVFEADNGKQLQQMLPKHPLPQVILMDINMPEMDGYEATSIIIENYFGKERPIIIAMTAKALTGDKENIISFGMDDYIGKPFKMNDVQEKIEQWMPKLLEKL